VSCQLHAPTAVPAPSPFPRKVVACTLAAEGWTGANTPVEDLTKARIPGCVGIESWSSISFSVTVLATVSNVRLSSLAVFFKWPLYKRFHRRISVCIPVTYILSICPSQTIFLNFKQHYVIRIFYEVPREKL
jgi:hypothetical protein